MKILSLFDGISCARAALQKAGIPVEVYYASEIDERAVQVAQKNFPDTVHIGDVKNVGKRVSVNNGFFDMPDIDLIIGGSPCQDLSIAKHDRKGLWGEKSGLFWEYVRVLDEVKPKYFILENVASMPAYDKQVITNTLGVEPIMINASLLSAQSRKRLFWTNIPNITQPADRGIILKDILEPVVDEKYYISDDTLKSMQTWNNAQAGRIRDIYGKSVTLQAGGGGTGAKTGLYLIVPEATKQGYAIAKDGDAVDLSFPTSKTRRGRVGEKMKNLVVKQNKGALCFTGGRVRKLTPIECERLQSLPDNWTEGHSDNQRYKMLGNAFNVDVIVHILSYIPRGIMKK